MFFLAVDGIHDTLRDVIVSKIERILKLDGGYKVYKTDPFKKDSTGEGVIRNLIAMSQNIKVEMRLQSLRRYYRGGYGVFLCPSYLGAAFENMYWKDVFSKRLGDYECCKLVDSHRKTFKAALKKGGVMIPDCTIVLNHPPEDIRYRLILETSDELGPALDASFTVEWDRALKIRNGMMQRLFDFKECGESELLEGCGTKDYPNESIGLEDFSPTAWAKVEKHIMDEIQAARRIRR